MTEIPNIINAFSIDVEDYFQVAAFDKAVDRAEWSDWPSRVERNTDLSLAVLDQHGVRGTFFVLGWIAERHPALIQRIAAAGHEVACHGQSHQMIYRQSQELFREETRSAKRTIEDAIGAPVTGYRAASFSIVEQSRWALDVLVDEGFEYDSSIFPVHHDNYGIPGASIDPDRLTTANGAALAEFPMTTVKIGPVRLPIGGGGYFRLYPYFATRLGLKRVNAAGRPFMFYLHPWELDPGQPRIQASLKSRFRHYNNLAKTEARLHRLLRDFRFASCRDVLEARGLLAQSSDQAA